MKADFPTIDTRKLAAVTGGVGGTTGVITGQQAASRRREEQTGQAGK